MYIYEYEMIWHTFLNHQPKRKCKFLSCNSETCSLIVLALLYYVKANVG